MPPSSPSPSHVAAAHARYYAKLVGRWRDWWTPQAPLRIVATVAVVGLTLKTAIEGCILVASGFLGAKGDFEILEIELIAMGVAVVAAREWWAIARDKKRLVRINAELGSGFDSLDAAKAGALSRIFGTDPTRFRELANELNRWMDFQNQYGPRQRTFFTRRLHSVFDPQGKPRVVTLTTALLAIFGAASLHWEGASDGLLELMSLGPWRLLQLDFLLAFLLWILLGFVTEGWREFESWMQGLDRSTEAGAMRVVIRDLLTLEQPGFPALPSQPTAHGGSAPLCVRTEELINAVAGTGSSNTAESPTPPADANQQHPPKPNAIPEGSRSMLDHEYALVGGVNRANVGRYLSLLAASVSGFIVYLLLLLVDVAKTLGVPASIPPSVLSLVGAGMVFAMLYALFNRYAWRWWPFPAWLKVPDLSGTWRCEGQTLAPDGKGTAQDWHANVVMVQSWDKLRVRLKTEQSGSNSITAALMYDSAEGYRLLYSYRNDPHIGEVELKSHVGFADLVFSKDLKTAEGSYFNGHGRFTFGTMQWVRA
jgi:hypothetical protein